MATKQTVGPASLSAYDEASGDVNIIVEAPKNSRNKFKYDETSGLFKLGKVLPAGAYFPFDFGFVPGTLGEDGDAVDVLVLMDEPAFVGCLVAGRVIGAIEAEHTKEGATVRNDRLIAVASVSRAHARVTSLAQLDANLVDEIEHFFVSYLAAEGAEFVPVGRVGPDAAAKLIADGVEKLAGSRRRKKR